jgi:hypothetical protein
VEGRIVGLVATEGFKRRLPGPNYKVCSGKQIANEPAFYWLVHSTVLRKRNRIVAKVKQYWQMTHKFGIRVLKTVEEALAINYETGTDFKRKALGIGV